MKKARVQNNSAERGHEPLALTMPVTDDEVIVRRDEQPRVVTLRPGP